MMDVSDGLGTDLQRMCAGSRCGATLDGIPVAPAVVAMASALNQDPQTYALGGGEDFELLVAVYPRAFKHLSKRFRARFGGELYRIGLFEAGSAVRRRAQDGTMTLLAPGWDHFA